MITVSILINGEPIFTRSAVRTKSDYDDPEGFEYTVDTGEIIKHRYEKGAVPLAHKLLDTVREVV